MMKLLKRIEQYQVEKENEFRAGREGREKREDTRKRGGMAMLGEKRTALSSLSVSHDALALKYYTVT